MKQWLYSLKPMADKLNIDAMKEVCEKLDNPQNNLNFIHIAGTNGKGSTSVMIQTILTQAGYKVGRYNSPHIIDFNERITINDKWISDEDVDRLINLIKEKEVNLSFFEFTTAMALQYFYENNVDYVVWETGLGGRLDATNIVNADYCVITNIALEHTEFLGNTIEEIAKEKAGIIKPKSIVIYGGDNKLKDIFNIGKKLVYVNDDTNFNIKLNLEGEHQIKNAKIAITTVKEILPKIKKQDIEFPLKHLKFPGRQEKIGKFILDCAHNEAAIKTLKNVKANTIIFGCMKDKNYKEMIKYLPKVENIIITKANNPRSLNPEIIAKEFDKCIVFNNVNKAIKYANDLNQQCLITGSCFIVSDSRKEIYTKYIKYLKL